jgi:hypothetical protein
MSAGKGDKLRKGANMTKYWDNYDAIFAKKKSIGEWQKHFNVQPCDYAHAKTFNNDEIVTEQQFKRLLKNVH